jgi:type VI secretion system protein
MTMKNILLAFFAFAIVGSAVPGAFGQSELRMKVEVSPDANNSNPVAVDLVLVKDNALLAELKKLSATDWFENRRQYLLDHPEETGLRAGTWEFVPGQPINPVRINVEPEIMGGIIFANYSTPGAHRAAIDPRKSLTVVLGAKDFTVRRDK